MLPKQAREYFSKTMVKAGKLLKGLWTESDNLREVILVEFDQERINRKLILVTLQAWFDKANDIDNRLQEAVNVVSPVSKLVSKTDENAVLMFFYQMVNKTQSLITGIKNFLTGLNTIVGHEPLRK